ncbi:predicted protein [Chaetoceros tenuissimus]|uniref:Uncharacterized protein n=1 Tax=Chaetoceros tenuissimus TaxID=426638 RepID=A0AAD3D1V9_9STRA|nr:predicted protein [Chaetoceros tenuissimus]
MGKSSKTKGKKLAKQERAMHLKNVEVWDKNMSTLENKFYDSFGYEINMQQEGLPTNGRVRERVRLREEQLQITLNIEKDAAFINQHQYYKIMISRVCGCLLFEQLLSANYIQASNFYNEIRNYPLNDDFRSRIKSFSTLLLLLKAKENDDGKVSIEFATNTAQNAFDIVNSLGAIKRLELLFIKKALNGLCQHQLFKTVELLSLAMMKNDDKLGFKKEWMRISRTFFVFSYIDELRISLLVSKEQFRHEAILKKVRKMRPLYHQLPSSTGHLANALLDFYTLFYEKEQHLSKSAKEIANKCIEPLEMYIASRSRESQHLFTHAATRILQIVKGLCVKNAVWFLTAVNIINASITFIMRRQGQEALVINNYALYLKHIEEREIILIPQRKDTMIESFRESV